MEGAVCVAEAGEWFSNVFIVLTIETKTLLLKQTRKNMQISHNLNTPPKNYCKYEGIFLDFWIFPNIFIV